MRNFGETCESRNHPPEPIKRLVRLSPAINKRDNFAGGMHFPRNDFHKGIPRKHFHKKYLYASSEDFHSDQKMRNHENDYFLKSDLFRWRLGEKCLNLKSSLFSHSPKNLSKINGGTWFFALQKHENP